MWGRRRSRGEVVTAAYPARRGLLASTASSVLPAVIAGVAAVGGAYFGGHAVLLSQREAQEATRVDDLRDRRAKVYKAYLDAANNYMVATIYVHQICHSSTKCA